MSTNVYIGARYVPIFDGDWDNTKVYEPLTIVNYNGGSYTSKRAVPANTAPTNTDYWALTGNYNGQIADLQTRVGALEPTVADNTADITDIIERTPVDGDYICFIGDSFVGAGSLGPNINQRFSTKVAGMLNLVEKNYAVGGTGYVTGTPAFPTQAQNAVDDFTNNNYDKSKVKYFVIGGGGNDGAVAPSNKDTFVLAVKNTINTIANNFPNATIVVIPYIWKAVFMPQNYLESINYICQAAIETLAKVVIIDDAYKWMIGRFDHILYQDGAMVHPDTYGHSIMARNCYSAMLGHNYKTPSYFSLNYLSPTYHSGIESGSGEFDCDGDYIHFRLVITVGANNFSGGTVMTFTRSNFASMRSFFLGDQTIFLDAIARNGDTQLVSAPKCYIQSTVNMAGDGAGTWTMTLGTYNGEFKANNKYYFDVRVPFGVIDTTINP